MIWAVHAVHVDEVRNEKFVEVFVPEGVKEITTL
jgi:hypothetical protein